MSAFHSNEWTPTSSSFFHFSSFFYRLIRCQPSVDSRLELGTRMKSFLQTKSERCARTLQLTHTHTHTSGDWQISLEIAYVIIASFGWIFILFSYDFQSLAPNVRLARFQFPSFFFLCVPTFIYALHLVVQSVVILQWIYDVMHPPSSHKNIHLSRILLVSWFLIKTHSRLL